MKLQGREDVRHTPAIRLDRAARGECALAAQQPLVPRAAVVSRLVPRLSPSAASTDADGADRVQDRRSGTAASGFRLVRCMAVIAATAVVGISAIGLDPMRVHRYETAGGERTIDCHNNRITLHDESRIAVQCTRNLLRAHLLRGEASFRVAHDNSSATIVLAGDARVDAVGSTFVLRRDPDRSTVTVLEGSVVLSAMDSTQRAAPSRSAAPTPVRTINEIPVWAGERAAVVNTGSAVLLASSRKSEGFSVP